MRRTFWSRWLLIVAICAPGSGCAMVRVNNPNRDLRPCDDGFAKTDDGWLLGVRRYSPPFPDAGKMPVVLCHGLGLNGTFWTITDNHLPSQLVKRGYDVFVVDMRGSGASRRAGAVGAINGGLRQTPIPEIGNREWTIDDETWHDVPAILAYVREKTGSEHVNWIGHSLGGLLMLPYLEQAPDRDRIANFVGMGCAAVLVTAPKTKMLRASESLRGLMLVLSTSRIARPMRIARPPGLEKIDSLYYNAANVDQQTISRFYGYTLEDPGPGALKQFAPFMKYGHYVSADGRVDYASQLNRIGAPTLLIAGETDVMDDIPSMLRTYQAIGSSDKTLKRYGKRDGQIDDYGHCDLVWSRHAPEEIFPEIIDWLDKRQPFASPQSIALPSPQADARTRPGATNPAATRPARSARGAGGRGSSSVVSTSINPAGDGDEELLDTDERPRLKTLGEPPQIPKGFKSGVR